jgi:hypothetical protein
MDCWRTRVEIKGGMRWQWGTLYRRHDGGGGQAASSATRCQGMGGGGSAAVGRQGVAGNSPVVALVGGAHTGGVRPAPK